MDHDDETWITPDLIAEMQNAPMLATTSFGTVTIPADVASLYRSARLRKRDLQPDRRFTNGRRLHAWFANLERLAKSQFQSGQPLKAPPLT